MGETKAAAIVAWNILSPKKDAKKLSMKPGMIVELYGASDCEDDVTAIDDLKDFLHAEPFYDLDDIKYTFKLIIKEPVQ